MLSIAFSVIILMTGIYFTFKTRFVQIFRLKDGFIHMLCDDSGANGSISPFSALCTTLAATLGTGNIVGVSVAICTGGPGALLWMVLSGFFGMALSYAEGYLAVKYRKKNPDGSYFGGPYCYIEKGMGRKWKPLAVVYALFAVVSGVLGIGTTIQVNSAASAVAVFFDNTAYGFVTLPSDNFPLHLVIFSVVITSAVALVIAGGIKRIASFSSVAVPVMSAIYMFFVLFAFFRNITFLPSALAEIVKGAFNPGAVTGGVVGSIAKTFAAGVTKGVFSNEAGLGTGAISASASRTSRSEHQGYVCMIATFVDTVVMCTLTGLVVVVTGVWKKSAPGAHITGEALTIGSGLPGELISLVLMVSLVFFAFTSIVGWCCYCEGCIRYIFGDNKISMILFRIVYIFSVFAGAYMNNSFLWSFADILNTFMALPNLVALIYLRGKIFK